MQTWKIKWEKSERETRKIQLILNDKVSLTFMMTTNTKPNKSRVLLYGAVQCYAVLCCDVLCFVALFVVLPFACYNLRLIAEQIR